MPHPLLGNNRPEPQSLHATATSSVFSTTVNIADGPPSPTLPSPPPEFVGTTRPVHSRTNSSSSRSMVESLQTKTVEERALREFNAPSNKAFARLRQKTLEHASHPPAGAPSTVGSTMPAHTDASSVRSGDDATSATSASPPSVHSSEADRTQVLAGKTAEQAVAMWADPTHELGKQFHAIRDGENALKSSLQEISRLKRDVVKEIRLKHPEFEGQELYNKIHERIETDVQPQIVSNVHLHQAETFNERFVKLQLSLAPSDEDIADRWGKIAASKADVAPEMLAVQGKQYKDKITTWLKDIDAIEQITTQELQILTMPISKADMLPNDILVRKERLAESEAHAFTLTPKAHLSGYYHNGIPENKGDINCFHVAKWSDGGKEITEARGGLGTTNAMRVLDHYIQEGIYFVYRDPKPEAKEASVSATRQSAIDTVTTGAASTVIGKIWAYVDETAAHPGIDEATRKKALSYSVKLLGGSMRGDGKLFEKNEATIHDMMEVAADPEKMAQLIDAKSVAAEHLRNNPDAEPLTKGESSAEAARRFHSNARFAAVRNPVAIKGADGKPTGETEPDTRAGGETCSTFIVRDKQTQILQGAIQQKFFDIAEEMHAQGKTGEEISAHLEATYGVQENGDMAEATTKVFRDAIDKMTGMAANDAEGTSPRTIDHFGKTTMELVGVLVITPEDVIEAEAKFDKKTGKRILTQVEQDAAAATAG